MTILRHAQFGVTMEIYTEVSDAATRAGRMKLGDNLTWPAARAVWLYFGAVADLGISSAP